jgi:TPR repeat protein
MKKIVVALLVFFNLVNSTTLSTSDIRYELAKQYSSKKSKDYDIEKAYNLLVDNVNENHSKSQILIGRFFLIGLAVEKDYEKALYYFKEASKQKEYNANCYIAYMYASGKGVFPNFGRAHVFAKSEYKRGNKVCKKVWKDYNLGKYPIDKGWNIGSYNKPVK